MQIMIHCNTKKGSARMINIFYSEFSIDAGDKIPGKIKNMLLSIHRIPHRTLSDQV
ncbi:hypothetical protein [Marinobacterium sediminicola]|uniref:hypothetical protein n=1 Tax=Marinobacterium sediminicola TaxID=518898 RepID=UPI0024B7977F|nr:hypothetical protein [Marinobacterium sediminicola]